MSSTIRYPSATVLRHAGKLTVPHKEILLQDATGEKYEKIAANLGISIGTVKSRLHRAKLKLADAITADPEAKAVLDALAGAHVNATGHLPEDF